MHAFFSPDNSDREPATGAQPARTPQAEDGNAPVAGPPVRITWGAKNTWSPAKQTFGCLAGVTRLRTAASFFFPAGK